LTTTVLYSHCIFKGAGKGFRQTPRDATEG